LKQAWYLPGRSLQLDAALITAIEAHQTPNNLAVCSARHVPLLVADGSLCHCSYWIIPTHDSSTLYLLLDVVHQTHRHSETSESAALMASILSHEIRNPLLAIRGAAQLLTPRLNDASLCEMIIRETTRVEDLLKEIDPLRGEGTHAHQPMNIHTILEEAASSVAAGIGQHIRITRRYDPSLPDVSGNAARLSRALTNLIKNAAESCIAVAQPEIILTTRYHTGKTLCPIALDIADNGEGIAESQRLQLFRPFVTTKREGRGLGLAIVARIIEDHGGRIELLSHRKGNTCFRLWLTPA
jgi:two-component system, NtrC family, nitrogen regulation sensor histidine kinase GlnL